MTDPVWSMNPERPLWAQGQDGTNTAAPDVVLTDETSLYQLAPSIVFRESVARGYAHVRSIDWATNFKSLEHVTGRTFRGAHHGNEEAVVQFDHAIASVGLSGGRARVLAASRTDDGVRQLIEFLQGEIPVAKIVPGRPRVPVSFWSLGQHGPSSRTRQIDVEPWEEILANYCGSTFGELAALMDDFEPGVGGRLLLWHGLPGTGKTFALRSLAWAWRSWCDVHYITDPETFFGQRASYMLDVILDEDAIPPDADPPADVRALDGRWRLLVLEDSGELMSADARERAGQGLSRLLNVVDGLIGQGIRVLVLVTTNEELRRLHPAVSRPGRCASKILFEPLPVEEAGRWLRERGYDGAVDFGGAKPVADLFALLEERETTGDREPAGVGFGS